MKRLKEILLGRISMAICVILVVLCAQRLLPHFRHTPTGNPPFTIVGTGQTTASTNGTGVVPVCTLSDGIYKQIVLGSPNVETYVSLDGGNSWGTLPAGNTWTFSNANTANGGTTIRPIQIDIQRATSTDVTGFFVNAIVGP